MPTSCLLNTWDRPSADLWNSLSMQFSMLQCPVLSKSNYPFLPDSQLCKIWVIHQVDLGSLSLDHGRKKLSISKQGKSWISLHFPAPIRDCCCFLFDTLKIIFSYILCGFFFFFGHFRWKGKYSSHYFILIGSRNRFCIYFILSFYMGFYPVACGYIKKKINANHLIVVNK